MRAKTLGLILLMLVLLSVPVTAADVSGKWAFDVELDMGRGSPSFVFQQDAEKLTGTYSGQAGEAKLTGTVKGTEIRFEFETDFGLVKYEGTIEGPDTMSGKADYAGQAGGAWTAKRSK